MQFLVEIATFGGYFSENLMDASLGLIEQKEKEFLAAGLDPNRDILSDGRAANAAKAAIDNLLEIEKTKFPMEEGSVGALEEHFDEQQHEDAEDFDEDGGSYSEDPLGLEYNKTANGNEATVSKLQDMEIAEITTMVENPGITEEADCDGTAETLANSSVYLAYPLATNSGNMAAPIFQEMGETEEPVPMDGPVGTLGEYFDKQQHRDAEDFVEEDGGRYSKDPVGLEWRNIAIGTEETISMLQSMEKAEMATLGETPGVSEEPDCEGTTRNLPNNPVYFEDPQAAYSTNATTPISQEMEETEVLPSESSVSILMEDCDKEAAEACVEEDATSSHSDSDSNSISDEEAANAADSVIEDNAEPELSPSVGTELVLGEVSCDLGDGWPTTNEAETVTGDQEESEGVDSAAMEGYEFILDEGSDEQEK